NVVLAYFGMDRSWAAGQAPVNGGQAMLAIKSETNATSINFYSRLDPNGRTVQGVSYQGSVEFDIPTGLVSGDWYSYYTFDAAGDTLNYVTGTIGGQQYTFYSTTTSDTVKQTVTTLGDTTNAYNYIQTANSTLQNNYLQNLAVQITQGSSH